MEHQHGSTDGVQRMHGTSTRLFGHGWGGGPAFVGYCLLQTLLCRIGKHWLAPILLRAVACRSPMARSVFALLLYADVVEAHFLVS